MSDFSSTPIPRLGVSAYHHQGVTLYDGVANGRSAAQAGSKGIICGVSAQDKNWAKSSYGVLASLLPLSIFGGGSTLDPLLMKKSVAPWGIRQDDFAGLQTPPLSGSSGWAAYEESVFFTLGSDPFFTGLPVHSVDSEGVLSFTIQRPAYAGSLAALLPHLPFEGGASRGGVPLQIKLRPLGGKWTQSRALRWWTELQCPLVGTPVRSAPSAPSAETLAAFSN